MIKFVYSQDHSTADMYEETKSILISKQGIPYPHDIRQRKFLRKEERQPSYSKHKNNKLQLERVNNENHKYDDNDDHRYTIVLPKAVILWA